MAFEAEMQDLFLFISLIRYLSVNFYYKGSTFKQSVKMFQNGTQTTFCCCNKHSQNIANDGAHWVIHKYKPTSLAAEKRVPLLCLTEN